MRYKSAGRIRVGEELVARTSRGLTERDRLICSTLYEHRVLTTDQIDDLAFDSIFRARQRMVALYRRHVVDRFRPFASAGSAPFHYVLGELGAAVAAAERGEELDRVRLRSDWALVWSRSQRLAHLVGVNGFFTSLIRAARDSQGHAELREWWSERRCAAAMGRLVFPDGYGVWREAGTTIEFCLEFDRATEPLGRVAAKLKGYRDLEAASGVRRWVVLSTSSARREAEARRALAGARVPVATANRALGVHSAAAAWLPLGSSMERLCLIELARSRRAAR